MNKRTYITFAFVMTMLGSITAQEEPNIIHQTNCSNEIALTNQAPAAPDSAESASGNRQNPPEAAGPSGPDLAPPSHQAQVIPTKLTQDTEQDSAYTQRSNDSIESISSNRQNPPEAAGPSGPDLAPPSHQAQVAPTELTQNAGQDSAYTEHSNDSVESVSSNRQNLPEAAGPSGPDLVPPSDLAQVAPTELTQNAGQDSAYTERHDGEKSLQSDQPNDKLESRAALYKKGILGLCSVTLGIVGNCLPLIVTLKGQSTYQEVPRAYAKHLVDYGHPGSLVALWATHAVSTALIILGMRSIKNAYAKLKQVNVKRMKEPTAELEKGGDNQDRPAKEQNNTR